jgi:signal transduction histidine kinase
MSNITFGIVTILLFVTLLVLFCAILIKLYVRKIKNYTKVIYQKDIDFQKALNSTIIETQEHVLNNISKDLHDDAGQQLTYINFQLENLKLDSPELNDVLQPISQSVGALSQSIRGISHSLNNQLLLKQDVLKAITAEVDRLKNQSKINFRLVIDKPTQKVFNDNEKIVIYRIFQESINNILKHAKAKNIEITIDTVPFFEMTISDDGKGFNVDEKLNKETMGLQNIINRAEIIDYKVTIQSAINNGTSLLLCETK